MTTPKEAQRLKARSAQARRESAYHHKEPTMVIGLRVTVAEWEAAREAMDRSKRGGDSVPRFMWTIGLDRIFEDGLAHSGANGHG
jgi:hypothetical protein